MKHQCNGCGKITDRGYIVYEEKKGWYFCKKQCENTYIESQYNKALLLNPFFVVYVTIRGVINGLRTRYRNTRTKRK